MFSKKNKKSNNIYSNYLKNDDASKSKSMKKLFDASSHSAQASKACATNRYVQCQVNNNNK